MPFLCVAAFILYYKQFFIFFVTPVYLNKFSICVKRHSCMFYSISQYITHLLYVNHLAC